MDTKQTEALRREYRPTMPTEILHFWAKDALQCIAELQAQLEAVGAGGVSPLMGASQAQPVGVAPAEWPRNAADVRQFMDANCEVERYANDDGSPSDDDRYQLTAHDFLSAVNWWADFPHHTTAPQPVGAVPEKILAGVIELAKAAHAHWDADRDAKVGNILMALAGWNKGYDWRADALHAAATAPQPAAQALDAWQPIATAPRDGTEILLGRAESEEIDSPGRSVPGYWQEGYEDGVDYMGCDSGFVDSSHQVFGGGRSFGTESHRYAPNQPTHWMPLPAPPAAIAAQQGGAS